MKKLVFLLAVLLPCWVFGQKATIEFEKTSYNFGTISESGGKVMYDFIFKNTGTVPLILTNVRTGCGCTTSEWDRQPIAPGASGSIKVYFDPRNRPGAFIKSIAVNSNASNPVVSLTVRGKVSRKAASPYDNYKFTLGTLKITDNHLNVGSLLNTQLTNKNLELVNSGSQPITLTVNSSTPAITVLSCPSTLQKGERGTLQIQYDPQKKNDWGFVKDQLDIMVNNQNKGTIKVYANITEDFSACNPETAPEITFSETETILEDLAPNTTYTHNFYIQNNGKSELLIRKLTPSDPNITASAVKETVKPGKKVKVTITFKTDDRKKMVKIIQFITNDPQNPIVNYKLTGNLK